MRCAAILLLSGALAASAAPAPPAGRTVLVADLNSEIHAVSAAFVTRVLKEAEADGAPFVILRIDTPGGRLDSTRTITQAILASPVPVVGWVAPPGAQAASAGFIVLMACDVAAMAPGTNAGAASPVGGAGEDLPKTLAKKAGQDVAALLRSVTEPRGRPVDDAAKAVSDAASYSETEALKRKLIEIVARDEKDLLAQLDGRTALRVGKPDVVLKTAGLTTVAVTMTRRERILGVLANPGLAGILFLIGLVGLYSELSHPGGVLPGVLGAIALLLALFAMSVLPVNAAGVALVLVGVLFFFLEVKLASHGVLAIGGAAAVVLGGILLFPEEVGAPRGEFAVLTAGAVATAAILAILSFKALAMKRLPDRTGLGVLVGQVVPARTPIAPSGKVFADGALWEAHSAVPVGAGELVEIVGMEGLTLVVRPARSAG
ncbi:MAG TPA: nodulation protein NfeD [Thermoanaerobaculia bacterium]|nr:nodulation protein NfeD [Thermoanaerobaculia bacterium]